MKIGSRSTSCAEDGRPDASVVGSIWRLGDLAEPLGFDSLFALEHHFTGYAMSPAPTQLLSLFRRPHQAHQARHRGDRAAVARPGPGRRADRAARHAVRRALPVRLWPRRRQRGIRGLPHPDGARRGRASSKRAQIIDNWRWPSRASSTRASSTRSRAPRSARARSRTPNGASTPPRSARNSAEVMAQLGFGMLVIMQNEWPKAAEDIARFRDHRRGRGPRRRARR